MLTIIDIIHDNKLFIEFRALSSQPRVFHVIISLELYIELEFGAHDLESFMSTITHSC